MSDRDDSLADSLPLSVELGINRLCCEFEQACRAGQSPRIEDFAGRMSGAAFAGALRELIAAEVDRRWSLGQTAEPEEYHQRFPQHAQAVNAAFELLDGRRPATSQLPETESFLSENASETDDNRRPAMSKHPVPPVPKRLGRFDIERLLGRGAFGAVYLARDGQLNRQVALKVPHRERFSSPEEREHFIEEARTAAQLTHPGIVTIHDVGQDGDQLFIVQEFIAGQDLGKYLNAQTQIPIVEQTARLMVAIAEAVAFAHQKGFVHRDLKPANILLDSQKRPRVADFGLAVHENIQRRRRGERSGTPAYMSPEQVRGETHRLDGRSDIWSLGVILYELLTGRRPFSGDRRNELFDEIKNRDPKPPRQIQQQVPAELERICLKCLDKRVTERYTSALDLASDLQHWLAGAHQPSGAVAETKRIKIVPKGLRSFDQADADFFLELLPGPRDRDGLPESIRFWKTRLEETDADRTFAVGLVYGPSGCGKSSQVKAGLLPRLASHVLPIYVEATGADTEVRLLKGLRKACPEIPADIALPEVFESLREGVWLPRGRKIVIVLDQFEQWLHARSREAGVQLIQALRHCDGARVQCLFLVRDDFWLATSRFLKALEIDLLERQNCLLVDLFDPLHARWVLAEFGRAFGRIPLDAAGLTADQEKFLDRAVEGLAEDGKVICVRLAVFADMFKGRPWNTASLEQVGGTAGLGMTFLEETFSAATAPAEHRLHQQAARAVLKALLPDSGTNIKGGMRSQGELLEVSGYAHRPREFADLRRILDSDLRLITPTDPEGLHSESGNGLDARYYQLTHDYLVPPLQDWLTRKQKETRRGRAELKLADRCAAWNAKPENRNLPSVWEYLVIVSLTHRRNWTQPQQKMVRRATRFQGVRFGLAFLCIFIVGISLRHYLVTQRRLNDRKRAEVLVGAVCSSPAAGVPFVLDDLLPFGAMAQEILEREFRDDRSSVQRRLHLAFGLAELDAVKEEFLVSNIKSAPSQECANIVRALSRSKSPPLQLLHQHARDSGEQGDWQTKGRIAIVALHLGEPAIAKEMFQLKPDPNQRTVLIDLIASWHANLNDLALAVEGLSDPPTQSGLCWGLGSIPVEELSENEKKAWRTLLSVWYQTRGDTGTHSAAGWALSQWEFEVPSVSETEPVAGLDWFVNSLGMTMLKVPSGVHRVNFIRGDSDNPQEQSSVERDVKLTRAFYISDRETSRWMFDRFISDSAVPDVEKPRGWKGAFAAYSPTAAHPVQGVSWFDAVLFCNWLSRREGLAPCYEGQVAEEQDVSWRLVANANGYRLPTEVEWDIACRAGTETEFACGNDPSFLNRYAVLLANQAEPCGSKLGNGWGLFDMHGNVWEWCQDWYTGEIEKLPELDPLGPSTGTRKVLRGGDFSFMARLLRSGNRNFNDPDRRHSHYGFRVVKTAR